MPSAAPPLPALFIDAASPTIVVGLQVGAAAGDAISWRRARDEAGVAVFRLADELLHARELAMADVRAIVFCEGPGSLLGVRLVAIALRTWMALPRTQPLQIFAYRSLALVAADALESQEIAPPFHVIADARRQTWNLLSVRDRAPALGDIRRWPSTEPFPETETLLHPAEFPHWQPLPAAARAVDYRPERVPALATRFDLLHSVDKPDAFLTESPEYRTWSGFPAPSPPARPGEKQESEARAGERAGKR